VRPFTVRQPFGLGDLGEVRPRRGHSFGRPRHRLPLERDARVQLERAVLDLYVVRLPQPVDPSLADVAPRSNEVAEDDQFHRHRSSTS
jgi:hypothetical protein